MVLIYTIAGLLFSYCILSIVTHALFHWCNAPRLSAAVPGNYSVDDLNLIQADAFFQRGRFFHEKGMFSEALVAYEKCFSMDDTHTLARQYHKYAQLRKIFPSHVYDREGSTNRSAPEDFSPLHSVLLSNDSARQKRKTAENNQQETIEESTVETTEEITIDFSALELQDEPLPTLPATTQSDSAENNDDHAFIDLGQTTHEQEIPSEVIPESTKTTEAGPHLIKEGNIKQKNQEIESAPPSYEELSEEVKHIFQQGVLDLQEGDVAKALMSFNRVIKAAPSNSVAYFHRASIHLANKKLGNAIADFTTAIEHAPDFGEAHSKRGEANILSNLYIDASNDFNRAIELMPDHLDSYINRGKANSQRGLRDEAITDFSKAIEIDPENDLAFYNRGLEWQNLGDYQNAMSDLNYACKLGNNAACIAHMTLQASE